MKTSHINASNFDYSSRPVYEGEQQLEADERNRESLLYAANTAETEKQQRRINYQQDLRQQQTISDRVSHQPFSAIVYPVKHSPVVVEDLPAEQQKQQHQQFVSNIVIAAADSESENIHQVNRQQQQQQQQQQQDSIVTTRTNNFNHQHKMSDGIEVEQMVESKPRRMPMATSLDKDAIREAYEDVRSDLTDTEWAVFKFDGPRIICTARGQCFEEFRQQFGDNERAFGYIRIQMGDEMSKRKKFIFLTWIGQNVGVIQRAKMSTDKALIKDVLNNFAVELQAGAENELDIDLFRDALNRAGGANYGTGVRNF